MALTNTEISFGRKHFSAQKLLQISHWVDMFDTFYENYIFPYRTLYLAHLIRTNPKIGSEFQGTLESLEGYANNVIVKNRIAILLKYKFERNAFLQAKKYALEGAEAGLADAQDTYGELLTWENGRQDEILSWYQKSAAQGSVVGKYQIALIKDGYYQKQTPRDPDLLKKVVNLYIESSSYPAIMNLALIFICEYENSPAHVAKGKELVEDIVNEYPLANYVLGVYYNRNKNIPKAIDCFSEAAKFGDAKACVVAAGMIKRNHLSQETLYHWLRKDIEFRKMRKALLEECGLPYSPRSVLSFLVEDYYSLGYYDFPANQPKESYSHSTSKTLSIASWIFWITIAIIVFKICS